VKVHLSQYSNKYMKIQVARTEKQTSIVPCPLCEDNLETHSNEQLQACALSELSKINRKLGADND